MRRVFGVLVLAAWAQRTAWCQFYNEPLGDGRGHNDDHHHQEEQHVVKPLYKYGYWVHDPKTKDVKNHWEHRDGDTVHGSYSLLQPDGHMRVVEYTADKHNGFTAHVKYMYEGHGAEAGGEGGGSGGGGGGGGGGGAAATDFGGGFDFGQHLDDASGGHSVQFGGPPASSQRPKQSLSKYYKKAPRTDKPGGPAGQYKRPSSSSSSSSHYNHHNSHGFDGRPRNHGGYKKLRLPPLATAVEQSAERSGGGGSHFFPASVSSGGGASPEQRYHGHSLSGGGGGGGSSSGGSSTGGGGGNPFGFLAGDQGPNQPSDLFVRKYGSSSSPSTVTPASAETSSYLSGIQYQSSEHDPTAVRRPDAAPAASTEPGRDGHEDEDDDRGRRPVTAKRPPQSLSQQQQQQQQQQRQLHQQQNQQQQLQLQPPPPPPPQQLQAPAQVAARSQRSHVDVRVVSAESAAGDDYKNGSYGGLSYGGGGGGGVGGGAVGRDYGGGGYAGYGGSGGEDDGDEDAVKVQKQPLMEFHFEDQPYPFELPEGLQQVAGRRYRAPHRKRHLQPQLLQLHPRPPYAHATSSYFPGWFAPQSRQFYYGA